MARKLYEQLRRKAAALNIEKNFKGYIARKSYLQARSSAIILQTGLRAMKARDEFRFRKQTKAAIHIQVLFRVQLFEKRKPCNIFSEPTILIFCVNVFRLISVDMLHVHIIKNCKRLQLLLNVVGGVGLLEGSSESLKWSG